MTNQNLQDNQTWGHDIGAALATAVDDGVTTHRDTKQAHARFMALVASTADAFCEALRQHITIAINDLNWILRRPLVRVLQDAPGMILTCRAFDRDSSNLYVTGEYRPEDRRPGIRLWFTQHRCRHERPYAFTAGADGLQLMIDGQALSAEGAARALLEPWASRLELLPEALAHHEQSERMAIDPLTSAQPEAEPLPLQFRTLTASVTADELDTVEALESAAFQQPWTAAMHRTAAAGGQTVVAIDATGRVIGFCVRGIRDRGLMVDRITIAEDARRKGFGGALVRHVLTEGASNGALRASVLFNRAHTIARRLYVGAGFVAIERPGGSELPRG
jgi:ribosomal-protein-alanine N-acetyltransferase